MLLHDEIYNYDLCAATKRKYVSTSALHKILPKNSIRRRAHKKVLSIRENDSKIIKFIDDKRQRETEEELEADGELTKCCELNNDKCVDVVIDGVGETEGEGDGVMLRTQSCSNLMHHETTTMPINCCDKTIQTSYSDLYGHTEDVVSSKYLSTDGACNNQIQQTQDKRKKAKRKQCSCRNYENVNFICETSLTIPPAISILEPTKVTATPTTAPSRLGKSSAQPKKSLLQLKKDKSDDKSSSGKHGRFTKQKNTTVDDDECGGAGEHVNGNNSDGCHENRVININDKSVEIFPISLNSSFSQSATPRGTSTSLHHDAKSECKSETQSQKSKRSKFSPSYLSRKLTSRLNSEDDGAGGVKESLLGRSKSTEKKLPEPVETVRINDIPSRSLSLVFFVLFLL